MVSFWEIVRFVLSAIDLNEHTSDYRKRERMLTIHKQYDEIFRLLRLLKWSDELCRHCAHITSRIGDIGEEIPINITLIFYGWGEIFSKSNLHMISNSQQQNKGKNYFCLINITNNARGLGFKYSNYMSLSSLQSPP